MSSPTSQIHGHEVLAMMFASKEPFTRESLADTIRSKFGAEARFFTCSASDMTAEDLVNFLEERGKFMPAGTGFTADPNRVCQH